MSCVTFDLTINISSGASIPNMVICDLYVLYDLINKYSKSRKFKYNLHFSGGRDSLRRSKLNGFPPTVN